MKLSFENLLIPGRSFLFLTGGDQPKFSAVYIHFETKEALETLASQKKWTISFVVEEIVKDWLKENQEHPEKL